MRLARKMLWNAAGLTLPLIVGVAVVPVILRGLGTERFGFLSVIWMLIGYFSIFDLGLSRTLTKLVADRLATDRAADIGPLASTALLMVVVTSAVMSVVIGVSAGTIASRAFHGSPALVPEARQAISCLAASLPFVLVGTLLNGLLEGHQRFSLINAVRIPTGIMLLIMPLLVLPFTPNLAVITASLMLVRIANALTLWVLARRAVLGLDLRPSAFDPQLMRPLLTYGGWLTVSNVVAPITVYFDRFLIAGALGAAAVAYYTVPYDVLVRLWVLPVAVQGVLFPVFSSMHVQKSPSIAAMFKRSSEATLLLIAPAAVSCMLLASEGLRAWVGPVFAEHSANTARILAIGVLVNSMARTPFTYIQSAGRAKWTAMLHVLEVPLYIFVLWWLLKRDGIDGAAYAWTARILLDTVVLYGLAVKLDPAVLTVAGADGIAVFIIVAVALSLVVTISNPWVRALLAVALCVYCGLRLLRKLLDVSGSNRRAVPVKS